MEIPDSIVSNTASLNRASFKNTRDKWSRPSFDLTGLKYLREKAGRERDVRELYRGRAPYELLQNADDVKATQAVFILVTDGLCFLHDGAWFSVANFRSLADGWSDKDPNQCIGHKGLGFRSVLDLTPSPAVVKLDKDWFGFRFGWGLNRGHVNETIRRNPELEAEVRSWSKHGQSTCPVMAIPGELKKSSLGGGVSVFERAVRNEIGSGLTTMFWLPASDPDADRRVVDSLDVKPIISNSEGVATLTSFVEREISSLLPFLKSLRTVSLFDQNKLVAQATLAGDRNAASGDQISVDILANSRVSRATYFQLSGSALIPPQVKTDPETPRAVRQMTYATVRLSCLLRDGVPAFDANARFHVYFPTDEPTGFGITIHGDFYVKPDRTRLMPGSYNEWLMDVAGRLFAGDFLNQLLRRYDPRRVFESLRPSLTNQDVGVRFRTIVKRTIQKRSDAFVPSTSGPRSPQEVALPTCLDDVGFWTEHFGAALKSVANKEAFLQPTVDSSDARQFLQFIGMEALPSRAILDLIEKSSEHPSTLWWTELYSYLATHEDYSRWGHQVLVGRRLLLTSSGEVIAVPQEGSRIVCFTPTGEAAKCEVPRCFQSVFVLLNAEVVDIHHPFYQTIRDWLITACRVARFESSDIVPRAIRGSVQSMYSEPLAYRDLLSVWRFLQRILALGRGIESDEFWEEIGRLPVPISVDQSSIAPAFLSYWPDGYEGAGKVLMGVPELRRVSDKFLTDLMNEQNISPSFWLNILQRAGVTGTPKVLRFVRFIGGGRDVTFTTPLSIDARTRFTGERQHDQNLAVIDEVNKSALWKRFVESAPFNDTYGRSIQQLTIVEALERCCALSEQESNAGDESWQARLWSLIHNLPSPQDLEPDQIFRRLSGGGGMNAPCGSFFRLQLQELRWLPSTLGPANAVECFVRQRDRRFISRGTASEELGDLLIPYVVADNLNDYVLLTRLGVEPLEDGASASTLVRFLTIVGRQFQLEGIRDAWLQSRSRWRLLRGAIQESYRTLNQYSTTISLPIDLCLAANLDGQLAFRKRPLFYAEPGSAAERAFRSSFAFLDTDRPYPGLFEKLGIARLIPGQTLDEEVSGAANAAEAPFLYATIVKELGPYLLAIVIAKTEEQGYADLVRRRLRDRFGVRLASELEVTFTLRSSPEHIASFKCQKFHLQRRVVELPGAIKETHYTMYVIGKPDVSLFELDGDALGEVLAPIYCDGTRDDYRDAFPRVVSRFQACHGDPEEMSRFLLESLNVSVSALDEAREESTELAVETPPPPAATFVVAPAVGVAQAEDTLDQRSVTLGRRVAELFGNLKKSIDPRSLSQPLRIHEPQQSLRVSVSQKDRGRRGEEEFMRRTLSKKGWEGFVFVKDTTKDNCGYDFECQKGTELVHVEVKAFSEDGRIVVSPNELKSAGVHRNTYYLVGFLDAGPEASWASDIIRDPFGRLLEKGNFDLDVVLEIRPKDLFEQ
ncbi:MAG: DUF3883 domain-containing protein [Acidobacteriia bacterium]|nr:DUF3883 domain-containing protein [Terriglobia bacterium]